MADIDISVVEATSVAEYAEVLRTSHNLSVSDRISIAEVRTIQGPANPSRSDNLNVYDVAFIDISELEFPEDLTDVPDLDRVYLVEFEVGREVELESWTASGTAFYCSFSPVVYGEIVRVTVNGLSFGKADSVASCQGSAQSFFYDFDAKRLYLHMLDDEAPDVFVGDLPKYCIVAYFWVCLTNRQPEDGRVIYAPQGLTHEVYYLPYLNSDKMAAIEQSVGDYYKSDLRLQYGSLSFVNDGWWYRAFETMYWHNAQTYIKVGTKGNAYENFTTILVGIARKPVVNDNEATLDVTDARSHTLSEIPITFFPTISDETGLPVPNEPPDKYLYLEPSAGGRPIPIPFGYCRGIIPVCVDPAEAIFKVSGYEIEEIVAVYENDVKLYPPVLAEGEDPAQYLPATAPEYSVNLVDGEFTLAQYYDESHVITCDVKGVKCSPTGLYSENAADIALYILSYLNGLPSAQINSASFESLREARTQKIGFNLDSLIDSKEILRMLQASSVFQLFPNLAGAWTAKHYQTGSDGALVVRKEDILDLGITYDTDGVFWQVQVKFRKDPATGEFLVASATDDKVKYRFRESKTLEVQTLLYDSNEAMALAQFYLKLVKIPPKTINGSVGIEGFGRTPSEKIILSKSIVDGDGNTVDIFSNNVYRVLEFRKDLGPTRTEISGLDDSISTGNIHTDVEEVHIHTDSYIDVPHANVEHVDWPHEDGGVHVNTPYTDTHEDIYNDYWNGWRFHQDHTDTAPHSDSNHWDYTDQPNNSAEEVYSDYPDAHGDIHYDEYASTEFSFVRLYHEDTHGDIPYYNDHTDSYGDTAHANSPEQDIHEQGYTDIPHGDSYY